MTIYCMCGEKNEYSVKKPVLCGYCGEPFDKMFKKQAVANSNALTDSYSDNEKIEIDHASIRVSNIPKKVTFEQVNNSSQPITREIRESSKAVTELIEKLKK